MTDTTRGAQRFVGFFLDCAVWMLIGWADKLRSHGSQTEKYASGGKKCCKTVTTPSPPLQRSKFFSNQNPPTPIPRPPAMIAGTKPKRRCQHTNELQSVFRHLLAFLHQLFVFLPQFFVFSHRLSFVLFSSTTETPWRN